MPARLGRLANEQSTYAIVIGFWDEAGAALIPTALSWTLTDEAGAVINGRSAVTVVPAASITVVLSGPDLDIDDGKERVLTVEGVYNSDLGSSLPLKDEVRFGIYDLVAL